MQIIATKNALSSALKNQSEIGFVPTMGNLHAGHIRLVDIAKQHAKCVVVSIFVNPLQFAANEDLAHYPRTLEADCALLEAAGADIVFAPSVAEMYADFDGEHVKQSLSIQLPPIADALCGASRPSHFAGVATVVAKLFNIVMPQIAVFGKKDFQQLFIIRELVKQLNYPIQIIAGETVRETDGLALSSRNSYLNHTERAVANQLNSALRDIVIAVQAGQTNYENLETAAINKLEKQGWQVDYIALRSSQTLMPALMSDQNLVVLGAAKIGNTRLIDNIEVTQRNFAPSD